MKSYQLHSAEDRRTVFAGLPAPLWLETELLRVWVVVEPALVLQVFRSPLAAVPSLPQMLRNIENAHGAALPNIAYACSVLPLLVEDAVHPAARKGFAAFLTARLAELEPQLPALSRSCMAPMARPGSAEIVSQVVGPYIERIFSTLLQCRLPAELLSAHIGDILSFNTNLALLKRLDSRIEKTLSFLRMTSASEPEVAWKFTGLVFGLGSLAMMLTEGIVAAVSDVHASAAGARLPHFPLETGVPVTFRRATGDFELGGCFIRAGDLMRLQLQCFGYSDVAEHRKFIFGAGMHSCVGKHLSLRIWDHFKREFDRLDLKARIAGYELFPSHFIILNKSVRLEVL